MRFDCLYGRRIPVILALAVIAALCLLTMTVLAQDSETDPSASDNMQMQGTMPSAAISGAGPSSAVASASNVDKQAWIYTDDCKTNPPQQTTGSIAIKAADVGSAASGANVDRADVVSRFNYPSNGPEYVVRFTCITPGSQAANFGGVGIIKQVFGSTGIGWAAFPSTLAYVAVFGNATITKDGATIAENQPATAMVTQAVHDYSSQAFLTTADQTRREIHLIVPGAMPSGGCSISGFPNGNFYIYWPDAALDIRDLGGPVTLPDIAAAEVPMVEVPAPEVAAAPTCSPVVGRGAGPGTLTGTLQINLTNAGIKKDVGQACAGLYDVRVTNKSSRCRGLTVSGIDLCCSPYNRFTQLLTPGKSQTFRFFFAPGKVVLRDFLDARRAGRSFDAVIPGKFSSSIVFQ